MAITYSLVFAFCSLIYFNDGVKANCGGLIEGTYGTITSPGYPENYPPNQDCLWEIRGPPNKNFLFHFREFKLEAGASCRFDFVIIKSQMKDGSIQEHGKFCGSEVNFNSSESNIVFIQFMSDVTSGYKGFEMDFFIVLVECNGIIEEREGVITSPGFPIPYPPHLNCTWNIQAPQNHIIKLTFTNFEIEDSNVCVQDYLTIQSFMKNGEIRQQGKFCGRKDSFILFSESNIFQIHFMSQGYGGHKGFKATFVSDECGGLIEGGKGNISSPFFPDSYPPNRICIWKYPVPPQHKIKLNFLKFEIEGSIGCLSDFLLIQSNSTDGKVFEYGKYCGHFGPFQINSKEKVIMTLVSDRSSEKKGFSVEYFIEKLTDFESSVLSGKSATPVENQHDDITKDFVTSTKEENTFSALSSLTKKVADMEERQMMFFNQYENMFNNFGKSFYNLLRM